MKSLNKNRLLLVVQMFPYLFVFYTILVIGVMDSYFEIVTLFNLVLAVIDYVILAIMLVCNLAELFNSIRLSVFDAYFGESLC